MILSIVASVTILKEGTNNSKRYFAVQHPYSPIPDTRTHPNWKIDPFLEHLSKVSIQAVHLPEKNIM